VGFFRKLTILKGAIDWLYVAGGANGLDDRMKISILQDLITGMVGAGCKAEEYNNHGMYVLFPRQYLHTRFSKSQPVQLAFIGICAAPFFPLSLISVSAGLGLSWTKPSRLDLRCTRNLTLISCTALSFEVSYQLLSILALLQHSTSSVLC
jgi:hypothetical protein